MGIWINITIHIPQHGLESVEMYNMYFYQVPHTKTASSNQQLQRNVRFYFCLDWIANDDKLHMGPMFWKQIKWVSGYILLCT